MLTSAAQSETGGEFRGSFGRAHGSSLRMTSKSRTILSAWLQPLPVLTIPETNRILWSESVGWSAGDGAA
jgi:hypothetical protein